MTGYGAGRAQVGATRIEVEIRSVNQRFLDVRVTVPRELATFERVLREQVAAVAARGRVEVVVVRAARADRRRYSVAPRLGLARAYVAAARRLVRELELPGGVTLTDVLRLPDLFDVTEEPPDVRREGTALRRAVAIALRAFDAERGREGAHLGRDMRRRVTRLGSLVGRMRRRLPAVTARVRREAVGRIARLVGPAAVDGARVAQEAAQLADRGDVTEELVRLAGHVEALTEALVAKGPVGRRIEFLLQEVQRELNTTGSKAADREIVGHVLEAKGELEKLREQIQNVE